jgi:hypothetical protein
MQEKLVVDCTAKARLISWLNEGATELDSAQQCSQKGATRTYKLGTAPAATIQSNPHSSPPLLCPLL